MAKKDLYNTGVNQSGKGLHTDTDPLNQPKGTYRFALNAINEAEDGQHAFVSNEPANYACTNRPLGFEIIGDCYIGDDTSVVIMVNPVSGFEEIGLVNKDNLYTTIVNTRVLNLRIYKQCQVIFRIRRGNERVIYWVDAFNKARTFNIDRQYNFYNN